MHISGRWRARVHSRFCIYACVLQEGQRGRGSTRRTAGRSFTHSADSSSVDASPPQTAGVVTAHKRHLRQTATWREARSEWERRGNEPSWESLLECMSKAFSHTKTLGAVLSRDIEGHGNSFMNKREAREMYEERGRVVKKEWEQWAGVKAEKQKWRWGEELISQGATSADQEDREYETQAVPSRRHETKKTEHEKKTLRMILHVGARKSNELWADGEGEKWREASRLKFKLRSPLALRLQFPLPYCNSNPGGSYENTLSVALEYTLTSKGFSHEAAETLLTSACPRQRRWEHQISLLQLPNCSDTQDAPLRVCCAPLGWIFHGSDQLLRLFCWVTMRW